MLFFLLALTVPVFYIIGLITILKGIFGSKKSSEQTRIEYLEREIDNLTLIVKKSPNRKVSDLLLEYVKELEGLKKVQIPLVAVDSKVSGETTAEEISPQKSIEEPKIIDEKEVQKPSLEEDLSKFWGNWYSDNSINLLLYIGAFLIVASASIYVGFQWETIGGSVKSWLLSLLTLGFFGFGAWFYNVPKIKNAGATFIAIGALLIPFCGLAWYNFVLEPQGYTIGSVWLVTSIIAVLTYSALAYFIRHPFYTYIAGFGGLSVILSLVNTTQLNREFFILGGIFSSFVLLASTRLFHGDDENEKKAFVTPLSISAHVIMPISLLLGLYLLSLSGQFFTMELALSAFLASLYYFLAYTFDKDTSFLTIGVLLLPASIFLFGKWAVIDDIVIYITIQLLASGYLLIFGYLKKNWAKESEVLFSTSQIILLIASLLGVVGEIDISNVFTSGMIILTSVALIYYLISYYLSRSVSFAVIAEVLFLADVYIIGGWLDFDIVPIYYLLEIIFFAYLLSAFYLSTDSRKQIRELTESLTIVPLAAAAFLFFAAFGTNIEAFHLTAFAVFPTLLGLLAAYFTKNSYYYYYNFIFLAISVYLYFTGMLGLEDKPYLMGGTYIGVTLILYLITLSTQNIKDSFQSFSLGTAFFAVLGFALTINEPSYFILSNITVAAILLDAAIRFKKYEYIYFSNLFIYVALWSILRTFDVRVANYPFFFGGLSYLIYLSAQILPENIKHFYRLTALVGVGANTLVFGYLGQADVVNASHPSQSPYPSQGMTPEEVRQIEPVRAANELERNALISSYAGFFLYSFDATMVKKASLGYFASAVGMLTYLWQMKYLGFSEIQVYTLPLGVYFITLAYLQRIKEKFSNQDLLNYAGLFFLLIPTLFQSFGADGAKYALLLGVEGIVIFALGNSLAYRNYIYVGIGAIVTAVIIQTYEFVFSLPWWMLTAVAGLLFLSTAIYLLLNRKEEPK